MNGRPVLRGASIFRQTLLLLAGSLLLTQLLSIALIISLPPPRPDFTRMSEIADALAGRVPEPHGRRSGSRSPLPTLEQPALPVLPKGMTEDTGLRDELAERLNVRPERVRLYIPASGGAPVPWLRGRSSGSYVIRHGEALFFDSVIAGLDTGDGWRMLRTPERPLIGSWQWRSILWFATSFLLLLPVAWLFARRLSLPIREFAAAADRIGRDASAPPVPAAGPVELRTAAQALNAMQARIGEYVRERTAMIGAIAHDLRTPLARIGFRVEGAPEGIREAVHGDIQEMTEMIAATVEFVRGNTAAAQRVPVDLAELLRKAADQAIEVGRQISLESAGRCCVTGDPIALRRLFQNLIDNAWKFGGGCEISVRRVEGAVRVEIADRGPGLAPEMLEKVFEPFFRTDPSRSRSTGGVGLGLTIARAIALDHGGALTLSNREGGGLLAVVEIPAG